MHWIVEPGFWANPPVQVALQIGAVVAVASAVVGVFTVIRGQSFAGHALTDVSTAGGSGASLISANPVLGFVGAGIVGAAAMEVIGVRRVRGRDLATGIVLGASLGLAALFLHLTTTSTANSGTTQHVLFGSIFSVDRSTIPVVAGLGVAALGLVATVYRPLLLSSVSDDMAVARGVRVRVVGVLFMLALAVAVGLSSLVIGSILSTSLLIGPAAAALQFTRRTGWAVVVASLIGIGSVFVGVLLAYDSFDWESSHRGIPVSFFIVAVVFAVYLLSRLALFGHRRPPSPVSGCARGG